MSESREEPKTTESQDTVQFLREKILLQNDEIGRLQRLVWELKKSLDQLKLIQRSKENDPTNNATTNDSGASITAIGPSNEPA